jgi:hypothetical protein
MRRKPLLWFGLLCWPLLAQAEAGPGSYSASYRLLFDGAAVGESFFRLKRLPGQGYRFDAYTLPSGDGDQAQAHEILESSSGEFSADGEPRPQRYYFSVFNQGEISLLEFRFDWSAKRLLISSKEQSEALQLVAHTQDRLSYLLALGRWLAADEGETRFPIAQPGMTVSAEFVRIESATLEIQAGSFETVHLQRVDAGDRPRRELWLEIAAPHRLIAMERHEPNGVARMELIGSKAPLDDGGKAGAAP